MVKDGEYLWHAMQAAFYSIPIDINRFHCQAVDFVHIFIPTLTNFLKFCQFSYHLLVALIQPDRFAIIKIA